MNGLSTSLLDARNGECGLCGYGHFKPHAISIERGFQYNGCLKEENCLEECSDIMQNWSCFGIVDSSLLYKTLKNQVDQMETKFIEEKTNEITRDFKKKFRSGSKPEIEEKCQVQKELSLRVSEEDDTADSCLKESRANKFGSKTGTRVQSKPRVRADAKIKKVFRITRKHIKKLFKSMNSKIIQKRYVNCSLDKIYERMRLTLQSIISEELLADDLVYYTIGILGIKKPSELNYKRKIQGEISQFNETNTKFTYKKLEKTLQSDSLRVLLRYMVSQVDVSMAETLENILDLQ
ncbi:unnamed protein product [Moneuplotes crassus]|uniref:Uncharacterized protein n=1 Tax=Euplotes crassus TaxID=5936 RepID=A0AAD1UDR1_EUPCR|nr:unnamed protein product [Moneuplotes crassus]